MRGAIRTYVLMPTEQANALGAFVYYFFLMVPPHYIKRGFDHFYRTPFMLKPSYTCHMDRTIKLRETTKKIISQLEEKSGYPVQVVDDKNLPVPASLRIARGQLPAHILSFNTLPDSSLDFIICWQCAMASRLFEREPEQRFQIASSSESSQHLEKILYAPGGVVNKFGLDAAQAASLLDQLLQGMIVHLYSIAVGLRVSDRLTIDYPELIEFESQPVENELQTNLSGRSAACSWSVTNMLPSNNSLPNRISDSISAQNTEPRWDYLEKRNDHPIRF